MKNRPLNHAFLKYFHFTKNLPNGLFSFFLKLRSRYGTTKIAIEVFLFILLDAQNAPGMSHGSFKV